MAETSPESRSIKDLEKQITEQNARRDAQLERIANGTGKAAERAKELAERELEDQKSDLDYSLAAAQLAEAAARLKALQKLRKK